MKRKKNNFPIHIEEDIARLYSGVIKRLSKKIIPYLKATYQAKLKADNVGPDYLKDLEEELEAYCISNGFLGSLSRISRALENWTEQKVADAVQAMKNIESRDFMLLAITKNLDSPEMLDFRSLYIQRNRELVENLGKEYLKGVSETAYEAFLEGRSMAELSEAMLEYTDGNISKADFWARDKLGDAYSSYTKTVHEKAGIVKYKWRTMGDNHVRGNDPKDETDHTQLEGRVFTWEDGAEEVSGAFSKPGARHPGEDYNCRCIAEPYADEEEDADES